MIALLGYAVLYKYAGVILLVFVLWLFLKAVVPLVKSWRDSARARRLTAQAERECLIIRANYENAMYLRGDPVGVYGHYTPPTLPLTRPLPPAEPRDWFDYDATDLDDYDDGLTEWRTT